MFDTGRDLVECHSGFRYGEKPVVVCWQGRRLTVSKVISNSHTPTGWCYRVEVEGGEVFDLEYLEFEDVWRVMLVE